MLTIDSKAQKKIDKLQSDILLFEKKRLQIWQMIEKRKKKIKEIEDSFKITFSYLFDGKSATNILVDPKRKLIIRISLVGQNWLGYEDIPDGYTWGTHHDGFFTSILNRDVEQVLDLIKKHNKKVEENNNAN
jgi:hypothetical protein